MNLDKRRFRRLGRFLVAATEDNRYDCLSRVVIKAFRRVLRELALAAVACGAKPHDVVNVLRDEHLELESDYEWNYVGREEVLSMIKTELEVSDGR